MKARFRRSSILGIDQELGIDWSLGICVFPCRTARMEAAIREGLWLEELVFDII
jgi:hypothetical protein